MSAKTIISRANGLLDRLGTITTRKICAIPGIQWRMHPDTWADLKGDPKVKANYLVNHKENRLLDIQVKLDIGCHYGDLNLIISLEDRATGGLIESPYCETVSG